MALPKNPVLPKDIKAVIPLKDDSVAEAIKKVFIRFPILWWKYFSWKYKENGDYSDNFKALICAVRSDCPDSTTTTT